MQQALETHPCFFAGAAGRFGRIHLPVAAGCNISCAYCRRDYDCVNENRPGTTSTLLSPDQALERLALALAEMPLISVAAVAGPGDAFHRPEDTLSLMAMIRREYPDLSLCISTNGYNLAPYVADLAGLGVGFVTITVNSIAPEIGAMVYQSVGGGQAKQSGVQGAAELIRRQAEALALLKHHGITVKINTVLIPGVNDGHIAEIAKQVGRMGADLMNIIPLIPLEGTAMAHVQPPDKLMIHRLRAEAGQYLPQMQHCRRCRADAVGLLCQSGPPTL